MEERLLKKLRETKGCLAHLATKDENARRRHPAEEDDDGMWHGLIPPFELDAMKVLHSKGLRRILHRTHVVSLSANAHTRTRGIHELEVAGTCLPLQLLGLNRGLLNAAALMHDHGHGPFGHYCEKFLTKISGKKFSHEIFGVVLAQRVERRGRSLNLTHQTLTCALNHSRGSGEMHLGNTSEEANALMYADKISYVFADFNDLFHRCSMNDYRFKVKDYPKLADAMNWFGKTQRERTYTCLAHLCLESAEKGHVSFESSEASQRFIALKDMMYEVYGSIRWDRLEHMLTGVYKFLGDVTTGIDPVMAFALLTEEDVEFLNKNMARVNPDMEGCLRSTALGDVMRNFPANLDFTNPDLDW